MKGKCPNCQKMNKVQRDGYCWCNCKDVKDSKGLWYAPKEELKDQDAASQEGKLFLDDEERGL